MPPERRGEPNMQDPHRVVQCAANPDVLWTQHHCATVRSTDGSEHWRRIEAQPSSFGFAVAVHPHESDTAWLVPARMPDSGDRPSCRHAHARRRAQFREPVERVAGRASV